VNDGDKSPAVVLRTFIQLGFLFDPNSFFATADKQRLAANKLFRCLAYDLTHAQEHIPATAAPLLLYAMACLEYRCAPLLPTVLDAIESHLHHWKTEVLTLTLYSLSLLGLAGGRQDTLEFDLMDGSRSRDYSNLGTLIAVELGQRVSAEANVDVHTSLHDWSRAMFALVVAGLYDVEATAAGATSLVLPTVVSKACDHLKVYQDLDESGWAQFFLYQTLYCVDVEKPKCEEAVKRAMPMWIQERLHHQWLDQIVLNGQPQGADVMQQDVGEALKRTNTQALLNCSAGRDWDEQHCWFAGFLLEPKVAIECDSMLPLGPGRPQPSGWISAKARLLQQMGFTVVTLHRCFWNSLTDAQKDEQLLRVRADTGYIHKDLERRQRKIRQEPHTRHSVEHKKKEWQPDPFMKRK